ncbi:tRNA (adenosine(37)-N6)-dimethylallyltransferase MiaA [Cecembia rubra]|uniref:tRNA dimethylallyltransferase n=1 Tax=Cecembia rubra TaxID=1485585 RepID=A0A2P8DRK6_9BACT|nr:tRNA (adenosine(37)-N6)-dimethylallyltransferase MiaA [Cecembia rubra]PSK99848.1 tRNA dimethylallyltransferase [Cecembia rubra]
MRKQNKYLIIVVGPTAVGKTSLCLKLAKNFQTEIISSDSRQFYKEMLIGTAKPSLEELALVKHHLIDHKSIFDNYDVKDFEKDALDALNEIFKRRNLAIMTGGSGLFVNIISYGMDEIPEIEPQIRAGVIKSYQEFGLEYLQNKLKAIDPTYYSEVDIMNPQRLMRAIEVSLGTGKPYSSFRQKKKTDRPFHIIKIGLNRDRAELYERIDQRMDLMIDQGLFEEAEKLFPYRDLNALQTVGYSEIFGSLKGEYDKVEAIRLLKRNSRRYAKRQLTWFRNDPEITWFHPDQEQEIFDFVRAKIVDLN